MPWQSKLSCCPPWRVCRRSPSLPSLSERPSLPLSMCRTRVRPRTSCPCTSISSSLMSFSDGRSGSPPCHRLSLSLSFLAVGQAYAVLHLPQCPPDADMLQETAGFTLLILIVCVHCRFVIMGSWLGFPFPSLTSLVPILGTHSHRCRRWCKG